MMTLQSERLVLPLLAGWCQGLCWYIYCIWQMDGKPNNIPLQCCTLQNAVSRQVDAATMASITQMAQVEKDWHHFVASNLTKCCLLTVKAGWPQWTTHSQQKENVSH